MLGDIRGSRSRSTAGCGCRLNLLASNRRGWVFGSESMETVANDTAAGDADRSLQFLQALRKTHMYHTILGCTQKRLPSRRPLKRVQTFQTSLVPMFSHNRLHIHAILVPGRTWYLVVHNVRDILQLEQSSVLALRDRERLLGHERGKQLLRHANTAHRKRNTREQMTERTARGEGGGGRERERERERDAGGKDGCLRYSVRQQAVVQMYA